MTPQEIKDAETEFRAILNGGQNNREFYLSASFVLEFFKRLLEETE